jgi:hypothetical protein
MLSYHIALLPLLSLNSFPVPVNVGACSLFAMLTCLVSQKMRFYFCLCPQFYTQPKTVTSKWSDDSAALCAGSSSNTGRSEQQASSSGGRQRLPGLDRVGAQ